MISTMPTHSSSSVVPFAVATLLLPITGSWSSSAILLGITVRVVSVSTSALVVMALSVRGFLMTVPIRVRFISLVLIGVLVCSVVCSIHAMCWAVSV